MHRALKFYGVITSIGVLIVLLQGATVTKTDSGEGCGKTWPLCFGEVIPTSPEIETIIEYSHRIVAGLVGVMILILAMWSWKKLSHMREARLFSILAFILIAFQGLLGAGAVVFGQSHAILALHFGISAMSLASVVILTILAFEDRPAGKPIAPKVTKGFKYYVLFVLTYCYAVIYSGAYVKHTEATLACSGFPQCNGMWFPGFSGPIGSHYFHRIVGILLFIFLIILLIWTVIKYREQLVLLWTTIISVCLVLLQIISGVSVVFTENSLTVGLMHALIVSLLFTTLSYMMLILTREKAISSKK
ncbi:COX15/CtaA family protein [Alkalihalobacillus pseudalcaliphilus]|uniref:COX15/CtaA family protein n=1 Tax=Alkalihalobacillus pseudalcaliphilus TaxID=79884 RepID=UPI00064DD1CA|nr:heme A synthase [Alkalihalobacillus pseudalcaliphilus]KMK77081.1 heme A synthase [Alkalihalobacillus pseudalcaliphilus]